MLERLPFSDDELERIEVRYAIDDPGLSRLAGELLRARKVIVLLGTHRSAIASDMALADAYERYEKYPASPLMADLLGL